MKKIWNWFVLSSANYQNYALTLKGILIGAIPAVIIVAHLANIQLKSEDLTTLIDAMITLFGTVMALVSAGITVFGLVRKVFKTANGTNSVLNNQ